jgi:hypothetical protein
LCYCFASLVSSESIRKLESLHELAEIWPASGTPTVDVHPGDGGGIGWGGLAEGPGGTKPLTLPLSRRERGQEMERQGED